MGGERGIELGGSIAEGGEGIGGGDGGRGGEKGPELPHPGRV